MRYSHTSNLIVLNTHKGRRSRHAVFYRVREALERLRIIVVKPGRQSRAQRQAARQVL
jgi:hypothetical protein